MAVKQVPSSKRQEVLLDNYQFSKARSLKVCIIASPLTNIANPCPQTSLLQAANKLFPF